MYFRIPKYFWIVFSIFVNFVSLKKILHIRTPFGFLNYTVYYLIMLSLITDIFNIIKNCINVLSELIEREHLERYNLKNVRRENNFNGSVIRRLISSKKKKMMEKLLILIHYWIEILFLYFSNKWLILFT